MTRNIQYRIHSWLLIMEQIENKIYLVETINYYFAQMTKKFKSNKIQIFKTFELAVFLRVYWKIHFIWRLHDFLSFPSNNLKSTSVKDAINKEVGLCKYFSEEREKFYDRHCFFLNPSVGVKWLTVNRKNEICAPSENKFKGIMERQ